MPRPRSSTLVLVLTLVLVAGAAASAWRWKQAEDDAGLATARTRDLVLTRAEAAAVALSSLDYRDPDRNTAAWKRAATGDLYTSLVDGQGDYRELVASGKVVTKATVTGAAVQSLGDGNRTAVVLVGLDVRVTPADGEASVEHERLVVTMKRTASGWKASAMEPVAG